MSNLPHRKPLRLKDWDYSTPGAYFVTICTREKKPLLARIILSEDDAQVELTKIGGHALHYLSCMPGIDQLVIMPNHIHFIVFIDDKSSTPPRSLPQLVSTFKSIVSKKAGEGIWQRGYYEHVIRNAKDYLAHVKYIEENPLKWVYDKYYV